MIRVLVDGTGLACTLWWADSADVRHRFGQALFGWMRPDTAIIVAWDVPGETWRKVIFPGYKAHRGPKPAALTAALEECRRDPSYRHVSAAGFEADDVIATLARESGPSVVISRDKDMAQLVGPRCVWVNGSGPALDADAVKAKFGVPPDRIRHLLSWTGDNVDGLPGIKGYGSKRAIPKALAGEIGNALTYELTELANVPAARLEGWHGTS